MRTVGRIYTNGYKRFFPLRQRRSVYIELLNLLRAIYLVGIFIIFFIFLFFCSEKQNGLLLTHISFE